MLFPDGVALAEMLKKNTTIETLELEGNNLGSRGCACLAGALRENKSLRSLNLESNNLTLSGIGLGVT